MTKFFMPGKSPEDAETLYQGLRDSIRVAANSPRIYRILFRDRIRGKWRDRKAIVGEPDPLEGRTVKAILKKADGCYVIWSSGRGFNHMTIDKSDVCEVEEFE